MSRKKRKHTKTNELLPSVPNGKKADPLVEIYLVIPRPLTEYQGGDVVSLEDATEAQYGNADTGCGFRVVLPRSYVTLLNKAVQAPDRTCYISLGEFSQA